MKNIYVLTYSRDRQIYVASRLLSPQRFLVLLA